MITEVLKDYKGQDVTYIREIITSYEHEESHKKIKCFKVDEKSRHIRELNI